MGVKQIRKRDIIAAVSKETGLFKSDVAMFYDKIEKAINEFLLTANENEDVEVRVFDGIYLSSHYKPAGKAFRPDLNQMVFAPHKINVRMRLTHGYKESMKHKFQNNSEAEETESD